MDNYVLKSRHNSNLNAICLLSTFLISITLVIDFWF